MSVVSVPYCVFFGFCAVGLGIFAGATRTVVLVYACKYPYPKYSCMNDDFLNFGLDYFRQVPFTGPTRNPKFLCGRRNAGQIMHFRENVSSLLMKWTIFAIASLSLSIYLWYFNVPFSPNCSPADLWLDFRCGMRSPSLKAQDARGCKCQQLTKALHSSRIAMVTIGTYLRSSQPVRAHVLGFYALPMFRVANAKHSFGFFWNREMHQWTYKSHSDDANLFEILASFFFVFLESMQ